MLSFVVIVLLLVCVRCIWPSYFDSYLNQDTEDLLHPLMSTFLPLYYNQLWTPLPNTSQYLFGLPLVNI